MLINWEEAFTYYASLPAKTRSYRAVALQFGVSPRTVEKHGQADRWKERLRTINAAAAAETDRSLGRVRAEHVTQMGELIQASLADYGEKLRSGDVRMSPADLERMQRLWGEVRSELGEPAEDAANPNSTSPPPGSPGHIVEVLRALRESGALEALGLRLGDGEEDRSP
ncbi:MAG: hypothetical protein C5B48_14280 [Candidatus Rokuibacteriota bacterium]|nr:MAG: hypothetical protein C5B48_14280 [Candidatus Rokubacteria bacterium]